MEDKIFDRKKFTWLYCGLFVPLATVCAVLMIYYASKKVVIVSADDTESEIEESWSGDKVSVKTYYLDFESSDTSGQFVIHCPDNYLSGFSYSNRIDKKTATLIFEGQKNEYFMRNAPSGDFTGVKSIFEEVTDDVVEVVIETEDYTYINVSMQEKKVVIKLEPVNKEETVVVLDPLYGGKARGTVAGNVSEADLNLAIALKVQKMAKDKEYRVELTRNIDETMLTEERLNAIEAYGADYYVGIGMRTDMEDTSSFGMSALYNDELYRNGFENVDFAEAVLKNTVKSTLNRAISLNSAGEENVILRALDIPGTLLYAGTITNSNEVSLLVQDEYIEKIAEGIVTALDSVVK